MDGSFRLVRRIAFNVFAWTLVLAIAFPLVWMILTSIKPQSELFMIPPALLPQEPIRQPPRRVQGQHHPDGDRGVVVAELRLVAPAVAIVLGSQDELDRVGHRFLFDVRMECLPTAAAARGLRS